MKKKTWVWLIILVVLIVAVAGYFWVKKAETEKIVYQTVKLDRGDVIVTITATGTLEAVNTVEVGSQVSGTIDKLYADFNSVVKEGQLLVQLDSTFLRASVDEQKANLDGATAKLNEAQRNYDRTAGLFKANLGTQADMDAATSTLESAKASLRQAEASLQRAEVNLQYSTIRAPISGVVISRDVDPGQTVAASLQAPTLFTIAQDLRQMQVEASIDEADIGSVKEGQRVKFTVDAYPDQNFDGTVSQVRLSPTISQAVVTYIVIIRVDNPDLKLMPGMTANVTVEVARADSALRVPLAAIRFTPSDLSNIAEPPSGAVAPPAGDSGGMPPEMTYNANITHIWTLEDGRLRPHRAIKGIQDSRYVIITDTDLKTGDEAIVGTGTSAVTTTTTGTNPFMPQMGGRRGGGPGGPHPGR
ncbi:MAG: efflux RND transporter periplasmic adaptor subunit [candidate division Zixibacteria bacterium]|nr:efflux RND transporter periplasmic adaptor subunit [candidate division Zixibacteria bacterium]